jgi:hypothetical protein
MKFYNNDNKQIVAYLLSILNHVYFKPSYKLKLDGRIECCKIINNYKLSSLD